MARWKAVRHAAVTLALAYVLMFPIGAIVGIIVNGSLHDPHGARLVVSIVISVVLAGLTAAIIRGYLPNVRASIRSWNLRSDEWLFRRPLVATGIWVAGGFLFGCIVAPSFSVTHGLIGGAVWGLFAGFRIRRDHRRFGDPEPT